MGGLDLRQHFAVELALNRGAEGKEVDELHGAIDFAGELAVVVQVLAHGKDVVFVLGLGEGTAAPEVVQHN